MSVHKSEGLQGPSLSSALSEDRDEHSGKQMQVRVLGCLTRTGRQKTASEARQKRPCEARASREREGNGRPAGLCLLQFGCELSLVCIVNFMQPLGQFVNCPSICKCNSWL